VYRDDEQAADQLAASLRRENEQLAEENARLRQELAARPLPAAQPASAAKRKKKDKKQKQRDRAARAAAPAAAESAPPRRASWGIRIGAGVIAAAISTPLAGYWLYPVFNKGETSLFAGIFTAAINQIWAQLLVAQPLLGWMPDEGHHRELSTGARAKLLLAGVFAIVAFAAFIAFLGDAGSNPD
jgi:hypothetical protein